MPNKQYGPMMFGQQKPTREPATVVRARKYGMADQLRHEQAGKVARTAMKKRLAAQRDARTSGAKRKPTERGMNAGTMGASRL